MKYQNVKIIFPPQFEPFQPYLSPAYIKGLLNLYGIESKCFDANIDFYWWLLNKKFSSSREKYLSPNIKIACSILKNIPASIYEYKWAINVINEHLGLLNASIDINLTSLSLSNNYSLFELQKYFRSPNNIFRKYFRYAQEKILDFNYEYLFLSIVVLDQFLAALTLSDEIKKRNKKVKIVFGGPFVTRFYKKFSNIQWINEIVDIFAPFEAHKTLPHILNIDSPYEGHVTPDFSDYDLNKYLSPDIVLPYLVSHGCKWGKCNFCSHKLSYSQFSPSSMDDVVEDISNLVKKHNIKYISFSDEYLTAKQLDELSTLLRQREINVKWSTFIRAENKFTDFDFTKKLYENGARLLMCGFESPSQRILNKMNKGNNANNYISILESFKKANIAARLDFMIGFPGETEKEMQKTFLFIKKNRALIDTPFSSIVVAVFELREDTPIMQNNKEYHIDLIAPLRGDLDEQYSFIDKEGLSDSAKIEWRQKILTYVKNELQSSVITPNNKTHQLILKDLFENGYLKNTVSKITAINHKRIHGFWGDGINIKYLKNGKIKIANTATGGIIELSSDLYFMVKLFETKTPVADIMTSNNKVNATELIKIINWLYRNDYLKSWYN